MGINLLTGTFKVIVVGLVVGLNSTLAIAKPELYEQYLNLSKDSDLSELGQNQDAPADLKMRGKLVMARSLGTQTGRYYAQQLIKGRLENIADKMDVWFNFTEYLETYGHSLIVPPIISEVSNRKTYDPDRIGFQQHDKIYLIARQPYFTDNPPSWRDYVSFTARLPKIQNSDLLPDNAEERKLYQLAFDKGWQEGLNAALETINLQLGRAMFDLHGMKRYQFLRDANLVSEPIIEETREPISGNKNVMMLGGKHVKISIKPRLNHNYDQWVVIPNMPPLDDLLPRQYLRQMAEAFHD